MEKELPITTAALIHSIAGWQTAYMNRYLHDLDLNNDQASVIQYVAAHSGTNQKTIADLLSRKMASVTNLLKSLEQKGFLVRRFEAQDVRTKHLYLTSTGKTIATQIEHGFQQLNDQIEAGIPEQNRTDLLASLVMLNRYLKQSK